MLRFSFELDRRSTNKNGEHPLKLRIFRSRTDRVFVGLKMFYHADRWDEPRERVVNTAVASIDNIRLDSYRADIGKLLLDIDNSEDHLAMSEIRNRVQMALGHKQAKPVTLCSYIESYAEKIPTKGTRDGFLMTVKKIREFDPIDRSFSQITVGWLRDFEMYYLRQGLKVNSLFMHTRNIRTIYNRAIDDGVAQLNDYPFRRFKIKQERTRKRALTVEQLRQLRDYPCAESQKQYRDIFMLIFYLGGINIGDLLKLTEIENGYIYYTRAKTHRPYQIKVEPEALEIINRYRGENHLLVAADRYQNHEDFTRRINRALRTIGAPLAEKPDATTPGPPPVDKEKGIFPGLSTYWARHSWATVAAELDIPKETIAKVLGHSESDVTSIYIAFNQKKIDKAIRDVIDFVNG